MFYQLKLKPEARGTSKEVFGVSVNKEVSTFVETVRDLHAEADKKNLKSVDITALDRLPERGEDGNAPHLVSFGDQYLSEAAQEAEANKKPADEPTADADDNARGAADPEASKPAEPTTAPELPPADETGDDSGNPPAATDIVTKQYHVLPGELGGGVEYPRGTVHEPGSILELTDVEVENFAPGLIEPVEAEEEN